MTAYYSLEELQSVLKEFEDELQGYSYTIFNINEKEKVFILEDSLVLYVGFLTYNEDLVDKKCNTPYAKTTDWTSEYRLRIEELTYNNIDFKYKYGRYGTRKLENNNKKSFFYRYLPYFRCDDFKCKYTINELIPQIQLNERNKNWNGVLYYFIVFEILATDNVMGIGIFYTTQRPFTYINNKIKGWIEESFETGNMNMVGQGPEKLKGDYLYHLEQAFETYNEHKRSKKGREFVLENYLKYFYIEKYIKDKDEAYSYAKEVLADAQKGKFKSTDRNTYLKPVNKWKSEELVYNIVKKLCKGHKVIYQHRPFCLKNPKGGQMSYDIFISGLNIAIEYQGRQHFEAIDFFGGKENLKRTIERDEIKKELSMANGIKLIYINYWENITEELIKNKINQCLMEEFCDYSL